MDGIIFDVDGTLWDSTETVAESWNKAIAENSDLDITIDGDILKNLFGKTMDEIYEILFPSLSRKEQERLGNLCFAYENSLLETRPGTLYEGVQETLLRLSKKHKLFIVSNCQCGYIELFLKASGLLAVIKDHLCFGQTQTPKGDTIRTLMERNGLKNPLYIGDTMGDWQACREAGIPFVFAEYGFGNVPEAKVKIGSISELPDILTDKQIDF